MLIFVSCGIWPEDLEAVQPFRQMLVERRAKPWTVGIDEAPKDGDVLHLVVSRIRKADGVIVIHTPRYRVDGYLSSVWLQREPVIAALLRKPVIEFFEAGVRPEALMPEISINRIGFSRYELWTPAGRERIGWWIEHFLWHVNLSRFSYSNIARPLPATFGLGIAAWDAHRERRGPLESLLEVASGGIVGWLGGDIVGSVLDRYYRPKCNICPRTYPPDFGW